MLSEKWTKRIHPKIAKDRGSRNSWDNNRYFIAQATKWSRRWLFPSDSCSSFRICKLHNGKLDGRNLYLKCAEFFSQRTMQYYRNIMLSPPDKRKLTELWTKLEKKNWSLRPSKSELWYWPLLRAITMPIMLGRFVILHFCQYLYRSAWSIDTMIMSSDIAPAYQHPQPHMHTCTYTCTYTCTPTLLQIRSSGMISCKSQNRQFTARLII